MSIIESALIATALRLSVSIARSTLPVTRPPPGDPEQSAALIAANTVYGSAGSWPRGYMVSAESLRPWSSFRVGAPAIQELNVKTAIAKRHPFCREVCTLGRLTRRSHLDRVDEVGGVLAYVLIGISATV